MAIKFGTSGWRDIIAEGFTFPNLRICTQAIAEEIFKQRNHNKPFIVGYDTRFLSEKFAEEAARILANNSIEVRLSERDVPTPTVAFEIIRSGAAGGINITASHNPFDFSGIKFSTAWGGPALPETTHSIEKMCAALAEEPEAVKTTSRDAHLTQMLVKKVDFRQDYLKQLKNLIDGKTIKSRKLKVVVDVQHGTGRGYLDEVLKEFGCHVDLVKDTRDVYFEGRGPDPSVEGLQEMVSLMKKSKADLGVACDGDSDRFAIVDAGGTIYSPNEILALLTKYIHQSRQWNGIVAKSVMTTHAIDSYCRKNGLEVKETPVGFKHIGEIMHEAESIYPLTEGEFVMGGEESGGFTMRGHVPEKDGILACLLVVEMVAATKKTIKQLVDDLFKETGVFLSNRTNLKADPEIVSGLRDWFSRKPPTEIDGLHVHRIVETDGFKFIFQGGSWLGVRFSGTEPIIRLYTEGDSTKQLERLAQAGAMLIKRVQQEQSVGSRKKKGSLALV